MIEPLSMARCRWTFSTMTIASSTRMPIAKISANSDTRLIVKPQAQEANSVRGERHDHRGADDDGLAPAHREQHQQHDRRRGEQELLDELGRPCRSP